ncbi:uncharacterized protein ASPGLDRAFT_55043 [Aspergillus glaucus CBS 516.65]|uniref:Leucine-rich repeat domain-containing protein n=1 Tax=Aspergillus glaucus CBS 516.65 TaxID=1160497 RepID=A0A1L9VV23_ASPGL|nr:hypothetical protein ASPGLDRAFT_55043 [Aspergillus glaucus CBS 516.65]OJJ87727.1 hypothetical protein ASPGLDRAFT_55043 [Aspergillus glaucus CBS 516.65]
MSGNTCQTHASRSFSEPHIRLIAKLYRHPDLANRVRVLIYDRNNHCNQYGTEYLTEDLFDGAWNAWAHSALGQNLIDEASGQGAQDLNTWKIHLRAFCAQAWIALLLPRLTYINRLELYVEGGDFFQVIFTRAAEGRRPFGEPPPYRFLREVCVHNNEPGVVIWSDFMSPFFCLPAVREIEVDFLLDADNPLGGQLPLDVSTMNRPPCAVTRIKVYNGIIFNGLVEWIATCTQLEHFEVHFNFLNKDQSYVFDHRVFRTALLQAKDTLLSIYLCFDETYHGTCTQRIPWPLNDDMSILEDTAFGSFKEFDVLQHLSMRHRNLVDPPGFVDDDDTPPQYLDDLLPKSLKTLEVFDIDEADFPSLEEELLHLISNRESAVPELEKITLNLDDESEDFDDAFIVLGEACREAGVWLILE